MALDPVSSVLQIGSQLIDRLWPDPTQAQQAKLQLLQLEQNGQLEQIKGQLAINATEAASTSTFVSGWRPFIGWVCGCGFSVQFVVGPLGQWVASIFGHPVVFPQLDIGTMMPLLLGMLGLGGLRTAEKINGVAAK